MVDAISQRVSSKDVSKIHIRFFSKQTFARYNKGIKVSSLLEAGLQILLLFFVLSRFYNTGRFTSQVRSLINIADANIYDAIGVSVPETSYEKTTSIRVDFTLKVFSNFPAFSTFIISLTSFIVPV